MYGSGMYMYVRHIATFSSLEHFIFVYLILETSDQMTDNDKPGYSSLTLAAKDGNMEAVKDLVGQGADVNEERDGHTPLTLAVLCNHLEMINTLVEKGADVNQTNGDGGGKGEGGGHTPLTLAVDQDTCDVHTIELLVGVGADVNQKDGAGFTPLARAAALNNVTLITTLARLGAQHIHTGEIPIFSPAYLAAKGGHVESVRALVELGTDVISHNNEFFTSPLLIATAEGHVDMIKALITLGADINKSNDKGWTPIHIAADKGYTEAVRALVALGADVERGDNKKGFTPLGLATTEGHIDTVNALIALGADVNSSDMDGNCPIHTTAREGYANIAKLLIEHGADVNIVHDSCFSLSAVVISSQYGHLDVLKVLVEYGADVNTVDSLFFRSPIHWAAERDHVDVIRYLVEKGVDVNSEAQKGHSHFTALLTSFETPLHCAAQQGGIGAVRLLVSLGADVDKEMGLRDCKTTPLHAAWRRGCPDIANFLVNCGARLPTTHPYGDSYIFMSLIDGFCDRVGMQDKDFDVNGGSDFEPFYLFSLVKLMSSSSVPDEMNEQLACSDLETGDTDKIELEINIGLGLRQVLPNGAVVSMQRTLSYMLRRGLVRIAWRVYQSSLLLDGDRLSASAKARRYTELVCLLLDQTMLGDVANLRMTCKSNSERQRFPVCFREYQELEANLIEECVAYASSRFVSTNVILAVISIHRSCVVF